MEDNYRKNIIDFSLIYLNVEFNINSNDFTKEEFTWYIFKELFNIDINSGYGLDNSTKHMTNNIGDLKIYNETDTKKRDYLKDIKPGDLIFFHTKNPDHNLPSLNNYYPGHTGIYLGNNNFIHASDIQNKIIIEPLSEEWLKKLVASRDIITQIIKAI